MNRHAAHVGDTFACPCATPAPHGTGMVVASPGDAQNPRRVMIDGRLAATRLDATLCPGGHAGTVNQGAANVFVNGRPLAREGDAVAHGARLGPTHGKVFVGDARLLAVETLQRGHVTVTVNRRDHTITLVGTQEYRGSGASQAYVDWAIRQMNTDWDTTVNFEGVPHRVVPRFTGRLLHPGELPDPRATPIDVAFTTSDFYTTSGDLRTATNQPYYGRAPGLQYNTNMDASTHSAAHEAGHAMGLPDEYKEGEGPDGERRCLGAVDEDLMGGAEGDRTRPTDNEILHLVTGDGLMP